MISFCAITTLKGKLLTVRQYNENTRINIDIYIENMEQHTPIVTDNDNLYVGIKSDEIIIIVHSHIEADLSQIMLFLTELINIFKQEYGKLTVNTIEENVADIQKILDDVCDGGIITLDEFYAWRQCQLASKPKASSTWINSSTNDIYVDLDEYINLNVGNNGDILIYEVHGTMSVHKKTGGTVQIGLSTTPNSVISLNDLRLSPNVKKNGDELIVNLDKDRLTVLQYNTFLNIEPMIWVTGNVRTVSKTRYIYEVELRCNFPKKYNADEVKIEIPVSEDTINPKIGVSGGKAVYVPPTSILLWRLRNITDDRFYKLKSEYHVSTMRDEKLDIIPQRPIRINFTLSGYTATGLQVRYVHIKNDKSRVWVKYQTKADEYYMRLSALDID